MGPSARQITARLLVVFASVVMVLALLAGYARRAAVNSNQFANRATVALKDDSVRQLIAQKITDDVVLKRQADLLAARPIIQSVAAEIVGSPAFTKLFRSAVRDVHRAVFDRDQNTVTLAVADVGTVLSAALEKLQPTLARKLDSAGRVNLVKENVGSASAKAVRVANDVNALAPLLLLLALVLIAAALVISPDRRRAAIDLGIGAAAAGVLLLAVYGILRSYAIHRAQTPEDQAAAGAVWDAFLRDLRTALWIFAGAGAIVAAAGASLIRPVELGAPLRRLAVWARTEPRRPALRALRGVAIVAVGVIVLVERDAVLTFLLALVGAYLIYEGVSIILKLVYRAPAAEAEPPARPGARAWLLGNRGLLALLIPVALIVGGVIAFVGGGGTSTAAPPTDACNGHVQLCDRRLDQVVLPATHNSMSVPLPGWFSAEQEKPISGQLDDGIRGFLLDTHYGDLLPNGKVRTIFGPGSKLEEMARQDGVSPEAVDAALRTRARLGFKGKGKRGMYLCHTLCEIGATPLDSVLRDFRDFLVTHPSDVVVVVNQDYVTPKDFVGAVNKAGLGGMVYRGPFGEGDWLTLRQMIDRNERIVFMAENHAGAAPWYQLAYKRITEETPYHFTKVPQLTDRADLAASCRPNRGPGRAPMFLVNHWLTTAPLPLPSNAAKVNAFAPLLARVRECESIRHHLPNLLAVNFYREGDLFRVVDKLNGVSAGSS